MISVARVLPVHVDFPTTYDALIPPCSETAVSRDSINVKTHWIKKTLTAADAKE